MNELNKYISHCYNVNTGFHSLFSFYMCCLISAGQEKFTAR